MSDVVIRPFQRTDREQVTALVNAHLAAIVPGLSVSTNTVLTQFEREPGEYVVDPWVIERRTLVCEAKQRIVAAAYLVRYGDDAPVARHYRDAAEIRWLLCWPNAESTAAGQRLTSVCMAQMKQWSARRIFANGDLPAPGAYGVPEVWPHIRQLLYGAGFADFRREEVLGIAVSELRKEVPQPWPELRLVRSVGTAGTRFAAVDADGQRGYLEIDTLLGDSGRFVRGRQLADIGNLFVEPEVRQRGVARWLLATAARWLELAGTDLLLTYLSEESSDAERAFVAAAGFTSMMTTVRLVAETSEASH